MAEHNGKVYVISNEEEKMEIREMLSESRAEFSRQYNIPVRTWKTGNPVRAAVLNMFVSFLKKL